MSIASLNDYIAAPKQTFSITKTGTRTSVAAIPFSVFDLAGSPGAGTLGTGSALAATDPATATNPVAGNTGYPSLNSFGAGATGYLSKVGFGSTVASRLALYDRLYSVGTFPFNANNAVSGSVPSARVSADYKGLQLWFEAVAAFTGQPTITVTYTNQDGVSGRSTGAVALGVAPIAGRCVQLPLQAGDTGIQSIQSVTSTVATVGTFNLNILRPLWEGRVRSAGDGDVHDMLRTGLPVIPQDAALYPLIYADGTSTGVFDMRIEIANK